MLSLSNTYLLQSKMSLLFFKQDTIITYSESTIKIKLHDIKKEKY